MFTNKFTVKHTSSSNPTQIRNEFRSLKKTTLYGKNGSFRGLADESLSGRDMAIVWTFLEGKIKYTDGWASRYVRLFAFGVEVSS